MYISQKSLVSTFLCTHYYIFYYYAMLLLHFPSFYYIKSMEICRESILSAVLCSHSRALLLLRKKKYQEQVLSRVEGQLENLERMVHDLEFAQIEVQVVDGLKVGNDALKQLHALLSIDEIEKVMDETMVGIEKQREINEILSSTVTTDDQIDESEIEAELDALMEAEIDEEAPEVPSDVLPEVPKDLPERNKERRKEKVREPVVLTA